MARSVATTVLMLLAALLAAIVALAAPAAPGAAFVVGAVSLVLALVATFVSVRRCRGWSGLPSVRRTTPFQQVARVSS